MKSFREEFRFWSFWLITAILLYAGSYACLTRASMYVEYCSGEPDRFGAQRPGLGFYYIPVSPITIAKNPPLERVHDFLSDFYFPLAYIDKKVTGAGRKAIPMVEMGCVKK